MIDPQLLFEVWVPRHNGGELGSGYRLRKGLVLTAGHVVAGVRDGACEVRRLGERDWVAATVIWRGTDALDGALLALQEPAAWVGLKEAPPLGHVAKAARVGCEALGFPDAQVKLLSEREVNDTEHVEGWLDALTGSRAGTLTIHISGSVPRTVGTGSLWTGMSGAPVFCGPLMTGLVSKAPSQFDTSRLEAVAISQLFTDPGFREAFGTPDRAYRLAAVEDADLLEETLRAPYTVLPNQAREAVSTGVGFSLLLRPDFGVVPFRERVAELARLLAWWDTSVDLAVSLVLGAGGGGKTRLAAECCRLVDEQPDAFGDGWTVAPAIGFLADGSSMDTIASLAELTAPLLLVVDDAASNLDAAVAALSALSKREHVRSRVLLLAREGGDWWSDTLPRRLAELETRALLAIESADIRGLDPVDLSTRGREDAFREASRAFAEVMHRSTGDLVTPDLSQETFESIFFVHLAALTALEGEDQLLRGAQVGEALLDFALQREKRYWHVNAAAQDLPLDDHVLGRSVAVATLAEARNEAEASTLLEAVPDLETTDQSSVRRATARWLRDLYPLHSGPAAVRPPGAPWFRPLAPDLLGEAWIDDVLQDVPELSAGLIMRGDQVQIKRTLTVLTQGARSRTGIEESLALAVSTNLSRAWLPAIEVGQEIGDPIGRLLAHAVEQNPGFSEARDAELLIPERTVALREAAVATARAALSQIPATDAPEETRQRAQLADRLSVRLSKTGAHSEAVEQSRTAVADYRKLLDGGDENVLRDLAGALTNLCNNLSEAGRHVEALAPSEQAVEIRERLRRKDRRGESEELAVALTNHGNRLRRLHRSEPALAAMRRAMELYQWVLSWAPSTDVPRLAYRHANAATNAADLLSELDRYFDALRLLVLTVPFYRNEYAIRPDFVAEHFVGALGTTTGVLMEVVPEHALLVSNEALEIAAGLAADRPAAFLPALIWARARHGDVLTRRGDLDAALACAAQARDDAERLVALRENPATLGQLADAEFNLHIARLRVRDYDGSLTAVSEAADLRRKLAEDQPDVFRPDLMKALAGQYFLLKRLGRKADAETVKLEGDRLFSGVG